MPNLVQPQVDPGAVQTEVPRHFPQIGEGLRIQEAGGTGNRSFVLQSSTGAWFLRVRNPKYADPAAMDFELDLLLHLKACSLPVHPPILSTLRKPWAQVDRHIIQISPWIQGEAFKQGEAARIQEAADVLRRWHKDSKRFVGDPRKPWEREDSYMIALAGYDLARQGASTQAQAVELSEALSATHRLLRELPGRAFWSLPPTIVHADYHPANMLFRGSRMVGLFDFDYACEHPRLKDIANALIYFAARRRDPMDPKDIRTYIQPFRFDREWTKIFLDEYQKDKPLTPAERKAVIPMMLGRWLQMRACGIIKLLADQRAEAFCNGMGDTIREIDSFVLP